MTTSMPSSMPVQDAILAKAILLAAGNKSGVNEKRFYRRLTAKADERFDHHLETVKG